MTELIGGGGGAGAHYLDSKTAILIVGLCFGLFTQSIFFFVDTHGNPAKI